MPEYIRVSVNEVHIKICKPIHKSLEGNLRYLLKVLIGFISIKFIFKFAIIDIR